uniref:Uncharacterized protein n=1 Tax=Chenopodium quinoa TaxID=63459 RepID=A0A803NCY5_CHEQI
MTGEWSISLWDLHRLGGLPIYGVIYDETVSHSATLTATTEDKKGYISKACEHLFVSYHCLYKELGSRREVLAKERIRFCYLKKICYAAPPKRTRYLSNPPQSTHDPNGTLPDVPTAWKNDELSMFERLDFPRNNRRAYTAAFLSC